MADYYYEVQCGDDDKWDSDGSDDLAEAVKLLHDAHESWDYLQNRCGVDNGAEPQIAVIADPDDNPHCVKVIPYFSIDWWNLDAWLRRHNKNP